MNLFNSTNIGFRKEDIWTVFVLRDSGLVKKLKAKIPTNGDYNMQFTQ